MGPVSPQTRIMRIAAAKAQALPSMLDERFAKSRKASLTTQNISRDFSCVVSVSFCMVIILWFATHDPEARPYTSRIGRCEATYQAARKSPAPFLTTEDQTEHEADSERRKDRLRRVLANVLLAVVLKTAYALECVIQYLFAALPIFINHRVRSFK